MYKTYKDANGHWRWRFVTNGRTIADSGEGYINKADCERGIEIMKNSANAPVVNESRGLLDGLMDKG